ncbi:MAG: hypothetical protein KDA80_14575 [Planctomycetaceae bacterium]|nr:hypothetical protein [Planctomycetaceae bacterium]
MRRKTLAIWQLAGIILLGIGNFLGSSRTFAAPPELGPLTEVSGTVVDQQRKPVQGASVTADYGFGEASAESDTAGRFTLRVPKKHIRGLRVVAQTEHPPRIGLDSWPYEEERFDDYDCRVSLQPARELTIRVQDAQGQPVSEAGAGVLVNHAFAFHGQTNDEGLCQLLLPQEEDIHTVYAIKPEMGLDYRGYYDSQKSQAGLPLDQPDLTQPMELTLNKGEDITLTLVDAETGEPIPDALAYPWYVQKEGEPSDLNLSFLVQDIGGKSDQSGQVTFTWLPGWDTNTSLTFWPHSSGYEQKRGTYDYSTGKGSLTIELQKLVPIRGRVTLPTGDPAPGISLTARGKGYSFDSFSGEAETDIEGHYEIFAAPNQLYLILIDDQNWAAKAQDGLVLRPGEPLDNVDFSLQKPIRVFGQVSAGPNAEPMSEFRVSCYQYGKGLHELAGRDLPNPENSNRVIRPTQYRTVSTDKNGRFEFFVGPGNYDIRGPRNADPNIVKFELHEEDEYEVNFAAPRKTAGMFTGLVVDGDSLEPVAGAKIVGIYQEQLAGRDLVVTTDHTGRFAVKRQLLPMVLRTSSPEGESVAITKISGSENVTVITLEPAVTITGRLMHPQSGAPIPNASMSAEMRVHLNENGQGPFRLAFGGRTTTDDDGRFELSGLSADQEYEVFLVTQPVRPGQTRQTTTIHKLTPEKAGETIDLKDIRAEAPGAVQLPRLR